MARDASVNILCVGGTCTDGERSGEDILSIISGELCAAPSGAADGSCFSLCTSLGFPKLLQGTRIFKTIIDVSFRNMSCKNPLRACAKESPPGDCSVQVSPPPLGAALPVPCGH